MEVVSRLIVQSGQVDGLGHLNHVAAVEILQDARAGWYRRAGLWDGRAWSEGENLGTIVLNLNINYRLECFLDEPIRVVTRPLYRGGKSYALAQEILKPDDRVAVDAEVTSLVMDMGARETLPLPECLARYLPPRE